MLDSERVEQVIKDTESNIQYIASLSDPIIKSYTSTLDELMGVIQDEIILKDNPSDIAIEKYFLELTNALYFVSSKCEFLGFYEDVSKAAAKLRYNEAYTENQAKALVEKTKPTVTDNQIVAENSSVSESTVNLIYSRSFKIIKTKIEAAQEMIKTLSKVLSRHMQETELSRLNNGYNSEQ